MKVVNLETFIDTLQWCKTCQRSGSNHSHVKQKLLRKPREACKSSWNPRGNQKSFAMIIPWKLANPVKIFLGIIVRQHRTDRKLMEFLRKQCAESRKGHLRYCCSPVWVTNGGPIPWNAILPNIQDLLFDGKTLYERRFGTI